METIAVVDFGGQYTHLLARRIRQLGVYSVIVDPATFVPSTEIGLIFSGGPRSVTDAEDNRLSIAFDEKSFSRPILGICYGHQLLAKLMGGKVEAGHTREYGLATIRQTKRNTLFRELPDVVSVWMSHGDHVSQLPSSCVVSASSENMGIAAFEDSSRERYGVQFHPEVVHTQHGLEILKNFVERCKPQSQWSPQNRAQDLIAKTRQQIGERKALLLLSGGVDSLVAWAICSKAIPPENLTAIHVDTGLMRKNESQNIMRFLTEANFTNVKLIEAEESFLRALKNKSEPEEKRKIIGTLFVDIANKAIAENFAHDKNVVLIQGTIYPDTIESGGTKNAAKIKTHHNRVSAIQELIDLGRVCEPLAELYKDEVREVGIALGLPHDLVFRHPFPGPGLGVRLLCASQEDCHSKPTRHEDDELAAIANQYGFQSRILPVKSVGVQGDGRTYAHPAVLWRETLPQTSEEWNLAANCARKAINSLRTINRVVVCLSEPNRELNRVPCDTTKERLHILREVDAIVTSYCTSETAIWQAPVVQLPLQNERGEWAFVIRPVRSVDGMTADFFPLSPEPLAAMLTDLKKIPGVGPLFYDVTSKPPATIEWE